MNNILNYKGYVARIEYDIDEKILFGKIEGIADLITFESTDSTKIEEEFHNAVDDYLDYCRTINKEPNKAFKGSFNVRIDPDLHRIAAMQAIKTNRSLNEFVSDAIKAYASEEIPTFVINNFEVINSFNNRTSDSMREQQFAWEEFNFDNREVRRAKLN